MPPHDIPRGRLHAVPTDPVEAAAMALAADYIGLTRDEWPFPNPAWFEVSEWLREAYRRKAQIVIDAYTKALEAS